MARNSSDHDRQGLDVRAELFRTLMSHVQETQYPSYTQLDMIEELMTDEERPAYVRMLIGLIDDTRFPSVPMLDRVKKFA